MLIDIAFPFFSSGDYDVILAILLFCNIVIVILVELVLSKVFNMSPWLRRLGTMAGHRLDWTRWLNRQFPSCLLPLFQNESRARSANPGLKIN